MDGQSLGPYLQLLEYGCQTSRHRRPSVFAWPQFHFLERMFRYRVTSPPDYTPWSFLSSSIFRPISHLHTMIGKGVKEYILIRIIISGFRLIAPTSLLYLAVSFHQSKFPVSTPLGLYAVFEAAFYLFVYLPRSHHIQKVRQSRSDILIHISNTHLGCGPSPTFNFWRAPTSLQEMQILYFQTRLSQWMVPFRLLKFKETERYPLDSLGSVLNRIMLAGMGGRNQPIPYRSRTYPRLSIRQRLQRRTESNATYIWSCCYAPSTTCLVYRKSWQFLNAIVLNNCSFRSLVVWTCGPRFLFALVDSNITPLRNGFIRSRPVPKLYYPKNLWTPTYHTGTVHIDQRRNHPFYSSMELGYNYVHQSFLT